MLYPPVIEGTIPAFTGTVLTVPFSMNKGVGKGEIIGFSLKLKTIQGTKYLFTTTSTNYDAAADYVVKFDLSSYSAKLRTGQHYKVQIAYIDITGAVGYYSTVGIVKYTTRPKLQIEGLKPGKINASSYNYIGVYSQEGKDISEKAYKYNFILTDANGVVVRTSDWQVHNSENDENPYTTYDSFNVPFDLEKDKNYYLQYKVLTNNDLEVSTSKYKITQQQSISPDEITGIVIKQNSDNGYVTINMLGNYDENGEEKPVTGSFLLSRTSSESNFTIWDEIARFKMQSGYPSQWNWKDFTVAQGVSYIYALQQYNDSDLYSERIMSDVLYVDFEDMFLYDGQRQLKIRYNPKVSSFKADIIEAKTDTIGGKYPFIFRNGSIDYKEFPINGLLSYLGDEEDLFITKEELGISTIVPKYKRKFTGKTNEMPSDEYFESIQYNRPDVYALKESYAEAVERFTAIDEEHTETTALIGYNIAAERTFKLKVLEWLNNGEPKLFRSPTEGNYLVRLMNNSLTPEDQLGRMLHNFSSTAYEIDECNYTNLAKYNIIKTIKPVIKTLRFKTVLVDSAKNKNLIDSNYAVSVRFSDMSPGDEYEVRTANDSFSIVIGATGFYEIADEGTNIYSITPTPKTLEKYAVNTMRLKQPSITYSFYENSTTAFSTISSIEMDDVPAKQFIGAKDNILKSITNIKTNILSLYYLHFYKREELELIPTVFYDQNKGIYTYDLFEHKIDEKTGEEIIDESAANQRRENYYYIYRYQVPKLQDKEVWGFAPIENAKERDFLLTEEDMKDPTVNYTGLYQKYNYRYYERIGKNNYIPVKSYSQWNEKKTFYKKKPFTFYRDETDPDTLYASQETYDRLAKDLDSVSMKQFIVYNNEFIIDKNVANVADSGDYEISGPIMFNKISTSAGVILECGYNAQIINYGIENTDSTLIELRKKLKDHKDSKNVNLYNQTYKEYITILDRLLQEE